jgi:hypothetical protein
MAAIKKAQNGIVKDKTSVSISKRKPDTVATTPNYTFLKSSKKDQAPTKQDSLNYKKGFNKGKGDKQSLFMASDMNTYMGSVEGARDTKKSTKLKSGGSVKAKDGKWIQSATASIKKRGTKGVCTGAKFGGPTCKPGTRRYSLAKTFKSIAKKKK